MFSVILYDMTIHIIHELKTEENIMLSKELIRLLC